MGLFPMSELYKKFVSKHEANDGDGYSYVISYIPFVKCTIQKIDAEEYLTIYIRTSSWDFDGDRSDIHRVTGMVLSLVLKSKLKKYLNSFDLENPAIGYEPGCYAKVLPIGKVTPFILEKVFESIVETHKILFENHLFNERDMLIDNKPLLERIELLKNIFKVEDVDLYKREDWNLISFELEELGVTAYKISSETISRILKNINKDEKLIQGISGVHLELEGNNRFVTNNNLSKGDKVLSILDQSNDKYEWYATENHIYLFGHEFIVEVYDPPNVQIDNSELELLQELQMHANKNVVFEWSKSINGTRFQEFIREILLKHREVIRVREVGGANEADGGRDLEVTILALQNFYITGAYSTKNVIVQCKAYSKNVGNNDVFNIRDTIEDFEANGYWLIVSNGITRSLYDRLDKMRKKGNYWIEWWGKTEIEQQLRRNLYIVDKFPDIVSYIK